MAIGAIIGLAIDIDGKVNRGAEKIEEKFVKIRGR